ncbi:hypothetical protein HYH02_013563 [Chlamydomonas schloesseri]|uniref:EF-hand domain-containing protein n=1 Tax=Chlamydomonas schloesseri TaxID=2026947 RepID=A0A835VZI0_9CHLO|nr:hypothetical protein HYH02_013563 [Chlamydomonas schloesseri]|eukprot:KAG2430721.1 hypothetical protein HYH02_013563 [Chlamydomonas schloesseri]
MDDCEASSSARSAVTLIHSGRLIRLQPHERPAGPVARETRTEDRPIVDKVHDKLFNTHRERFVHKVLRSYAQDDSGLLTPDQLRSALDRLHTGLDAAEKDRIVARVAPAQHGKVHYMDFIRSLQSPQPLGSPGLGVGFPGVTGQRPAAAGGAPTFWNWQRHNKQQVPGLLDEVREGTFEQAQSDALLTSIMSTKLNHHQDKLRLIFRQMDGNRNSLIDREEFMRGIAKLRINVSKAQVDRLFDLCDVDKSGAIDYEEFVNRFEANGLASAARHQTRARPLQPDGAPAAVPLAQSLGLTQDEVAGALSHPMVHELARSLYGKAGGATSVFVRNDLTRCGRLAVRDMTRCCQALVPGIGEREVAAVMAAVEPDSGGPVDYRAFVQKLTETGVANPRMLHSAPARGEGGTGSCGALTRFGEGGSLTAPDALPSPGSRSLSAVGTSRSPGGNGSRGATMVLPISAGLGVVLQPGGTLPPGAAIARPAADRTSLDDLHDVCVAPFLESLSRTGGTGPGVNSSSDDLPPQQDRNGAGGGGGLGTALPSVPVTRSIDMGTLSRSASLPNAHGGSPSRTGAFGGGGGGGGFGGTAAGLSATGSKAPTHATGRFSRFWDKRYADTSHVTSVDPASAAYASSEGGYVRKGWGSSDAGSEFLTYQGADRDQRQRQRQVAAARSAARSEVEARMSGLDDASGLDAGRLQAARAIKQRYEERAEMYDRTRQQHEGGSAIFGRAASFNEHQLVATNNPLRTYW